MDLTEKSRIVQKSLHPQLNKLPPVLSPATTKSIHKVSCRKRGHILEGKPEFNGVVLAKDLSNKKSEALAGPLDEVEWGE